MFEANMMVKLNAAGLKYVKPAKCLPNRHTYKHWSTRKGKILSIAKCKKRAFVIWEDRKSAGDAFPIQFLMPL